MCFLRGWFIQTRGRDHFYPTMLVHQLHGLPSEDTVYSLLRNIRLVDRAIECLNQGPSRACAQKRGMGLLSKELSSCGVHCVLDSS